MKKLRLLFFANQLLVVKRKNFCELPAFDDWPEWVGDLKYPHNLGVYNNCYCYAAEVDEQFDKDENYVWMSLRSAVENIDQKWFSVAARAYQIINWDKNHRYCGRCGQETKKNSNIFERQCLSCNLFFYPKISPSIIVLIRKANKILLARKSEFPAGVYGLIAGFVEPGESLEEALHREVAEEVGISIKNIHYFGSQPWPFPDSLMLAFIADYAGGEIELNDGELESAGWYDANHLPGLPSSASCSTTG
ncbi:NAD(+) diphosphatase [Coxiella burnetii]|uniref:NAD(+) diphosphatase n=1 Tax=Coxiella burnetii (strain RSA 493 / Nine Mile phase I) TaxID=227377 RepID=Q83CZ6_COXBU|nr:NAD(+) diphosphatase [Coxiella burnetii]NP_819963.1 MutT/nudix family phosphohydrolase [Coxiella burnetii RSA 493]AAO90477.1 phosphohydrolase (MutT/nudix family protein) [Coxiella burnetii RSA 493]ARI65777.1 NADH pyrophosphatase [Coxiella burnetii]ARK27253.1 NADH pyrophosphatase [Coxiella burnetii]MCF2092825.1 NAD(+) diphosphatase [Coxiella burnetii]MCF2094978.1 NAD(+) diphosphatase [Coxiella burnetii]